jgi:hypothetical protein
MLECLHPDCDKSFSSKAGRNVHFSYHDDCEKVSLELLSEEDNVTYDNCTGKVGLSPGFYEKRFGSWNEALEKAGNSINLRRNISDKELLEEIKRMSSDEQVTYDEMNESGKYSSRVYELRFGSWDDALVEAGLEPWDRTAENNPCWRGGVTSVKYTCEECGVEFKGRKDRKNKYCSLQCKGKWISKNKSGENSPLWKGGHTRYRGPSWNSSKRAARERANNVCEHPDCSATPEDVGRNLDVHHIIPFRYFDSHKEANKLDNLILLCPKHHKEEESRIWRIEALNHNP